MQYSRPASKMWIFVWRIFVLFGFVIGDEKVNVTLRCTLFRSFPSVAVQSDLWFGEGSGPVLATDLMCLGNEGHVMECPGNWDNDQCAHNQGVYLHTSSTKYTRYALKRINTQNVAILWKYLRIKLTRISSYLSVILNSLPMLWVLSVFRVASWDGPLKVPFVAEIESNVIWVDRLLRCLRHLLPMLNLIFSPACVAQHCSWILLQ